MSAAAAPLVLCVVWAWHLSPRLFSPHSTARPTTDHAWALWSFVVTCSCSLLAHYLWMRETAEARPVLAWRELEAEICCAKARMLPHGDRSTSMRHDMSQLLAPCSLPLLLAACCLLLGAAWCFAAGCLLLRYVRCTGPISGAGSATATARGSDLGRRKLLTGVRAPPPAAAACG